MSPCVSDMPFGAGSRFADPVLAQALLASFFVRLRFSPRFSTRQLRVLTRYQSVIFCRAVLRLHDRWVRSSWLLAREFDKEATQIRCETDTDGAAGMPRLQVSRFERLLFVGSSGAYGKCGCGILREEVGVDGRGKGDARLRLDWLGLNRACFRYNDRAVLRLPGGISERGCLPMDTETILALCAIFSIVIKIVGLGRNK